MNETDRNRMKDFFRHFHQDIMFDSEGSVEVAVLDVARSLHETTPTALSAYIRSNLNDDAWVQQMNDLCRRYSGVILLPEGKEQEALRKISDLLAEYGSVEIEDLFAFSRFIQSRNSAANWP